MKIAVAFLTLALAVASAKSYTVNVVRPTFLAGAELKAGEYRLEVNGDKILLINGVKVVQASVKVENTTEKNGSTTLRMEDQNGKLTITEIRLGGTNTKLVVN